MKFQVILVLLFTTTLFAQNKIDSLFKSHDHFMYPRDLNKKQLESKSYEEKLPLQYLQLQFKMNMLDEKFLSNNKLLQAEIKENYFFSADELNSGLSENELIGYLKNKKEMMKIIADTYSQRADVNWDKIQKMFRLTKTTVAIIFGIMNLIKYH